MWVLTLIFTGIDDSSGGLNTYVFLGPSPLLLNTWGAKNPYEIQHNYQVWRFVTPAFLSNGFSQCFVCVFLLLLIGSMVESAGMHTSRVAGLYFVCTIGGYLFGATCDSNMSVGALPGVFGLISALFGNVVKNWKALAKLDSMRWLLIIFSMGIYILALLITMQSV